MNQAFPSDAAYGIRDKRPSRTRPMRRPRMRHMLKWSHVIAPYRRLYASPIRLVSIGCRAVCAVVTGFACGCGTCRRLAGWVFVILVSGDRYAQIRSCRCRSTLSCVCALVHTPPSKPRDQKKCDTHWSSPRVLSTTKGLGIYRLHGNRVVSVSHCVCGHG